MKHNSWYKPMYDWNQSNFLRDNNLNILKIGDNVAYNVFDQIEAGIISDITMKDAEEWRPEPFLFLFKITHMSGTGITLVKDPKHLIKIKELPIKGVIK